MHAADDSRYCGESSVRTLTTSYEITHIHIKKARMFSPSNLASKEMSFNSGSPDIIANPSRNASWD